MMKGGSRNQSNNLTPLRMTKETDLSYSNLASNNNILRTLDDRGQHSQPSLPSISKPPVYSNLGTQSTVSPNVKALTASNVS